MTVDIKEAEKRLSQLIASMSPGETAIIVSQGQPVATLVRNSNDRWPCQAGSAKDTAHWMAPDFDAPLDEFREYME